jgi:KaiC/GvpD/RAD55 family RecA-like ATPase
MYRKDVSDVSPLRILERSIHGGLGQGHLGVVIGPAGVGKTAVLVQIGLDETLRGRSVLHVALGQNLDHVQAWYDALFDDLAAHTQLAERDTVRASAAAQRIIHAQADRALKPERLDQIVSLYETHAKVRPAAVIIDGWDWEGPEGPRMAELTQLKATARRLGAELWMSAQNHRRTTPARPAQVMAPCAAHVALIEVALYLDSEGDHATIRLLKDHDGHTAASTTHIELDSNTMRLRQGGGNGADVRLPPRAYTLLSGGAPGTEAEFGVLAERFGLAEVTFSFAGRTPARDRALLQLDDAQLEQGHVSLKYVEAHLHRTFPRTPMFEKILQSLWHQVATAGEVFVVGVIQPDGTVVGGTGWAAELAKHFARPLCVFDQERKAWHAWREGAFHAVPAPRITRTRFAGTGTRFLSDAGRAAIEQLFVDSFGPAPA